MACAIPRKLGAGNRTLPIGVGGEREVRLGGSRGAEVDRQPETAGQKSVEFIDFFMSDPSLCRLYTALSALDPDTAEQIRIV